MALSERCDEILKLIDATLEEYEQAQPATGWAPRRQLAGTVSG
jgi:hypothetical protein